jgi:phenylpropionate dioxygenase-like ring-hydroxylating dioxygenase large terminal subunit
MELPFLIGHVSEFVVDTPRKLSILGKHYVMWLDQQGNYNIISDVCPHLGASLSRGKIKYQGVKSCVQCPFHTLQFDGRGYRVGQDEDTVTNKPVLYVDFELGLVYFLSDTRDNKHIPDFEFITNVQGIKFGGIIKPMVVKSNFEKILSISYDLNHVAGTHQDYFNIQKFNVVERLETSPGDWYVRGIVEFKKPSLLEKLKKPNYFFIPTSFEQEIFSFFPTMFITSSASGKIRFFQYVYYYPIDKDTTLVGGLYFTNVSGFFNSLLKPTTLESIEVLIQQDQVETQEQYPDHVPKFELQFDRERQGVIEEWKCQNFMPNTTDYQVRKMFTRRGMISKGT